MGSRLQESRPPVNANGTLTTVRLAPAASLLVLSPKPRQTRRCARAEQDAAVQRGDSHLDRGWIDLLFRVSSQERIIDTISIGAPARARVDKKLVIFL